MGYNYEVHGLEYIYTAMDVELVIHNLICLSKIAFKKEELEST